MEIFFNILDRIPTIDGEPWMNNGIATNDGEDPDVPRCAERNIPYLDANFEGNMVFENVNFAYPTRQTQKNI